MLIDSLSICFLCAFQIITNICLLLTGKQQVSAEKQIMFVLKSKLNIFFFFFLDTKTSKRVTEVKQQLSQYFWLLRLEERCWGSCWYWCKTGWVLNANTINNHTLIMRKFEWCQTVSDSRAAQHSLSSYLIYKLNGRKEQWYSGVLKSKKWEDCHSHGEEACQLLPSLPPSLSIFIFYHFTFTEWPGSYVFDTLEMKLSSVQGEQF